MALILFLVFSLLLQGALVFTMRGSVLGDIACEQLPTQMCSFSIASSGKRCLLEYYMTQGGSMEYQCKTSPVVADIMHEWIETDDCIRACGVDRNSIGISSDSLLQPHFTMKLCSSECYDYCPNIVDLYFNLATAEGVYLPSMCEAQRTNMHRAMMEIQSSGHTSGPVSAVAAAPVAEAPLAGIAAGPVAEP
ncbi:hypothetical protein CRG98_013139 [Punica granatum]|uniref:PAR1 protein n=1 Tax=Punica granatum TaxID=22663 RepID=A0A2I0KE66_PUNGR|nr:hypothetical protein CRG98_013139 [Punica granatum]